MGVGVGVGLELPCDNAFQRGTIKPENMKLTNNINVTDFIGCRLAPWICSGYSTVMQYDVPNSGLKKAALFSCAYDCEM
jgi:hypothetical protein